MTTQNTQNTQNVSTFNYESINADRRAELKQLVFHSDSVIANPFALDTKLSKSDIAEKYKHKLYHAILERNPVFEETFKLISLEEIAYLQDLFQAAPLSETLALFKAIKEETLSYGSYEEAVYQFKHKHNHDLIDYLPEEDGKTHINVYSKGKTELGRLLSNFGHTPFDHPEYGHFSSIEGFWYWLSTGKKTEDLRFLFGYKAKQAGLLIRQQVEKYGEFKEIDNFKAEIKKAMILKVEQNARLCQLLRNSSLPLTHYYVWGNEDNYRISYPRSYAWIHEYLIDIRDYLNGKAHKLLVAGSRDITDVNYVMRGVVNCDLKVIEIVSGLARGVDTCAVEIARRLEIPCQGFPADWKAEPKRAGMIRNSVMSKYATFALIYWDGKSPGTKNMIDTLTKDGVNYKLFKRESDGSN